MLTIAKAIQYGSTYLAAVSDSAKLDSQILLAHCLAKETSYLLTWLDKVLSDEAIEEYKKLLDRRQHNEPIAYIVGNKEFWSLNLAVSPATLIPRPDTETLVEQVLAQHTQENLTCLDLGTGTGAIALALASEQPTWQITAVDYSVDAVELAKTNQAKHELKNVAILHSNWFSALDETKRFDVIVSNPPYIDSQDSHLFQGDVVFEPESALVSQDSGLADIKLIAMNAVHYLSDYGSLYFEHGYQQANDVQMVLKSLGYFDIHTIKDYNNNDRVTFARYKK